MLIMIAVALMIVIVVITTIFVAMIMKWILAVRAIKAVGRRHVST